jgi:hypothetical protein
MNSSDLPPTAFGLNPLSKRRKLYELVKGKFEGITKENNPSNNLESVIAMAEACTRLQEEEPGFSSIYEVTVDSEVQTENQYNPNSETSVNVYKAFKKFVENNNEGAEFANFSDSRRLSLVEDICNCINALQGDKKSRTEKTFNFGRGYTVKFEKVENYDHRGIPFREYKETEPKPATETTEKSPTEKFKRKKVPKPYQFDDQAKEKIKKSLVKTITKYSRNIKDGQEYVDAMNVDTITEICHQITKIGEEEKYQATVIPNDGGDYELVFTEPFQTEGIKRIPPDTKKGREIETLVRGLYDNNFSKMTEPPRNHIFLSGITECLNKAKDEIKLPDQYEVKLKDIPIPPF